MKPWQWRLRDIPIIGVLFWFTILLFRLQPSPWIPPDDEPEMKDKNAA